MQREIKFRAWDGKYIIVPDREEFLAFDGTPYTVASRRYNTPHTEIEPATNYILMQYSGISDKNGVDMCEGDLIKVTGFANTGGFTGEYLILPLVWDRENAKFDLQWPQEYASYQLCDLGKENCEVVGNIYENKSLLTSQNSE